MCLAIGAVVGVLQSAVSFAGAMADYNAKAAQWKQNFTNSMAAGVEDQRKLALRTTQEQEAFAQKQHLVEVDSAQAQAEAEVSGAEGGVGGLSLDNILTGLERDTLTSSEANRTNYQNTALALTAEMKGTETAIQNQINSVQRPVAPNPFGYLLSGIGGVLKSSAET